MNYEVEEGPFPVELDLVCNKHIFTLISWYYWCDNGIIPAYILQLIVLSCVTVTKDRVWMGNWIY
jgi:hypothetical protein